MSQPVLECVNPWETECLCGAKHMPCWPRPDTSCCDRLEPVDPTPEVTARIERMLHVATEIIWRLSGKQFGACPVTVRPCRQSCADRPSYGYWSGMLWTPVLDEGTWFNLKCDTCFGNASGCACSELCEVDLPGPVAEILDVKLDGEVLPSWMYRVDNHRKLVRTGQLVPLAGPTSLATVQIGAVREWCDPSPTPDATTDFTALGNGCYSGDTTNPTFQWNAAASAEATYSPASTNVSTVAFFNGFYPAGIAYDFGAVGQVLNAGESLLSDEAADGSYMRVTVLAGQATRVGTPYSWDVVQGTRIRMERLGRSEGGCWPKCQELAKADTEDGTFSVRYRRGQAVPQGGLWAAGLLACQLLKACDADEECALPANAQRIARQGVTVELTPVLIDAGKFATGIPEVDLWLQSVNPYQAKAPSRVYSVDRPAPRTMTWPCS